MFCGTPGFRGDHLKVPQHLSALFQILKKKITLKKSNEGDILADLCSNVTLKKLKNNSSLDKFWIQVHAEYKVLSEKALRVLHYFPSPYSRESGSQQSLQPRLSIEID